MRKCYKNISSLQGSRAVIMRQAGNTAVSLTLNGGTDLTKWEFGDGDGDGDGSLSD